jgi:hypothetical protein
MKIWIIIIFLVMVLLIWGFIGSAQSSKIGTTCDLGINSAGSVFCWKWHRNVIGDLQDNFDDVFGE